MAPNRRFEIVMTPSDFERLSKLSEHYSLSRGAIMRLALHELCAKIETGQSATIQNPLLKPPTEALPPEVDDFWKVFRS